VTFFRRSTDRTHGPYTCDCYSRQCNITVKLIARRCTIAASVTQPSLSAVARPGTSCTYRCRYNAPRPGAIEEPPQSGASADRIWQVPIGKLVADHIVRPPRQSVRIAYHPKKNGVRVTRLRERRTAFEREASWAAPRLLRVAPRCSTTARATLRCAALFESTRYRTALRLPSSLFYSFSSRWRARRHCAVSNVWPRDRFSVTKRIHSD